MARPDASEQRWSPAATGRGPGMPQFACTALVALAAPVSVLIFFRETVTSLGARLTGDVGDARLYIVILEHWLAVFRGDVPFRSPIFFWPEPGVLGYSDTVALFLPPYVLARACGLDRYLAYQATLMSLKAIGFAAMYLLLRRSLRVERGIAALGATLFTISNASYLAAGHTQLLSVALVPLVWLLAWRWERRIRPDHRCRSSYQASLALLLFTSFYIGWFTLLVSVLRP